MNIYNLSAEPVSLNDKANIKDGDILLKVTLSTYEGGMTAVYLGRSVERDNISNARMIRIYKTYMSIDYTSGYTKLLESYLMENHQDELRSFDPVIYKKLFLTLEYMKDEYDKLSERVVDVFKSSKTKRVNHICE